MSQKEDIINLLKSNGAMTQGALAETMYGDKNHGPNIYAALIALVNTGVVLRTGSNPSYYSLSGVEAVIPERVSKSAKKEYRDVSVDVITNASIEEAEKLVQNTDNYGPENDLISRCLHKFDINSKQISQLSFHRLANGDKSWFSRRFRHLSYREKLRITLRSSAQLSVQK